jgi:hypothetical protein
MLFPEVMHRRAPEHFFYHRNLKGYEPHHDKTNIMRLQPAWIQTSLRIRAV